MAPIVKMKDLYRLSNEVPLNKTKFFQNDQFYPNGTCFSNKNIDVNESSGQIVLPNGQCFELGRGGYAAFDMTKDQKIAICRGTLTSNKAFQTAIKNNRGFPGSITIFT